MDKIYLYDTWEGKKREFVPLAKDSCDIYYCGPTVYNYVHLGNFRPTITFDVLSRFLTEEGYNVRLVSNYTDIDDKIINEAKKEGKTEKELSQFYIHAYEECLTKLNISPLYSHPLASDYIYKMADFIKVMLDNKTAYRSGTDTYFSIDSDFSYGSLSKENIEALEAGARIDVKSTKRNPLDFALWKVTDDDGIKFDTPLGKGRPGWHTECVVMVNSVFGKDLIDIHGGGFDLKFPHHENEIAQSMAVHKTRLANYWMHVGFLLTNGVKMSKSLGNSILAKDVLSRHSANAIRLFFESTYYRAPVNYTEENLTVNDQKDLRYRTALRKTSLLLQKEGVKAGEIDQKDYREAMLALADDLNCGNAIAVLDRELKEMNSLSSQKDGDRTRLSSLLATFLKISSVLGLSYPLPVLSIEDRKDLEDYEESRKNKDYQKSDEIRKKLIGKGIL
jgi:cysteinyl-tRNA synthetase